MNSKKIDILFYIIPIFLIVNLFIKWEFTQTISPDSEGYMDLARHFPYITEMETYNNHVIMRVGQTTLFPLGYPIFLKMINSIFDDYLISYKVGAFLCVVFSLAFVRIKDFYWREIWMLFTFYPLLKLAPWAWAETLLVPLLIMVFYYNHRFLSGNISSKKFIFFYPVLLFLCVFIKYSSLFFIITHFIFGLYLRFIKDKKSIAYFKVSILSLGVFVLYLFNNYFLTGFMTGERATEPKYILKILYSFSQVLFCMNPFINIGTNYREFSIEFYLLIAISALSSLFILYFFWKNIINFLQSKSNDKRLLILMLLHSGLFLMGTIYSYFTTKIDALDYRLLLGYYLFFFFAVIISLPKFKNRNIRLFIISMICLFINTLSIIISI